MAKSMVVIFASLSMMVIICSGLNIVERNGANKHSAVFRINGSSLLKCEDGRLEGGLEFFEFLEKVTRDCNGPPLNRPHENEKTIAEYYICLARITGMTEIDGTPNVEKIDAVTTWIYSEQILNNLPAFKKELHRCALAFETNYNRIDKPTETGAELYFECFTDVIRETMYIIGGDFDKVCNTKEKITAHTFKEFKKY